ncbi:beta-ketoacyl-[acyl-carrier-protein] synthase family protein [Planctomicrobium piriforme]|uniref:3-oxoacyl-[acyl-carrier-protein] synthase II n=1 Tax=Planctomicrobium piriforme TaxID=1576369 RepID=A0A1I3F8X1_9PLAN|nr:beta-ketoacyl-[acyl-carrier-protein] synthase family protein [Planctomicrobium piriforme]SFI07677.1 3-oxoacyl-[acyl-carrier-protein] synthase II [Planctomicrobium piriforme]
MVAGNQRSRVVITGVGVVSPVGIGQSAFWSNMTAGRSGITPLSAFPSQNLPCKLAAEIRDFDPLQYIHERKFLKVMSRDIQLGVSAATLAMQDAGLVNGDVNPDRLGVEFGAGHISFTPDELADAARLMEGLTESEISNRWGPTAIGKIAPLWLLKQCPNMPACHVAIEHGARGPNNTITSADASALLALQESMRCINRGHADVMIVGACSSNINPVDIARISLVDTLSPQNDPEQGCRPFDRDRDGSIVGEGSAVFIVERYSHAVARGAEIYCEVLGVGAGCDGRGDENVAGGRGLSSAMGAALRQANVSPRELGHINAHGKSTRNDDWVEARAYHHSFGDDTHRIPVVALKSYFGNFDAGSGAVELAGSILSLKHGELPATLNYKHPDPLCRLNVSRDPQRLRSSIAMTVNRTSMGQSAAAILRAI